MAITAVQLIWSGPAFADDSEGVVGYTQTYRVYSNTALESAINVRAALPLPGAPYPGDPKATVKSRSADRPDNSRLVWDCTVQYEFDPEDPEDPEDNPLDEPIKFRWTAGLYTKAVIKDRDDKAIVNSAGDYFDPPPEIEEIRWSVNVQENVASVPLAILTYANRVNQNSFTIDGVTVDAEAAKVIALDISEFKEKNDIGYRTVTYTIEFREEGWDLEMLDQGFRIKDAGELKDILVEDEDGNENRPSAPVLLNGDGGKLTDPTPENAEFLTFPVHKLLDFAVLPGTT